MLNQDWQDLLDYEKSLNIQLNALDQELDIRWNNLMPESQRRDLFAKFQATRTKVLRESTSLRARGDKIIARYAELSKDDTVTSAIRRELGLATKTRIPLGPSQDFNRKAQAFERRGETVLARNVGPQTDEVQGTQQGKSPVSSPSAKSKARPK